MWQGQPSQGWDWGRSPPTPGGASDTTTGLGWPWVAWHQVQLVRGSQDLSDPSRTPLTCPSDWPGCWGPAPVSAPRGRTNLPWNLSSVFQGALGPQGPPGAPGIQGFQVGEAGGRICTQWAPVGSLVGEGSLVGADKLGPCL